MNTTAIAIIAVIILAVGVYVGISGLAHQYAIVPGGSNANQYACEPDKPVAGLSAAVTFSASVPEGTPYYWSAPGGTASFVVSGPLTVRYARTGSKNVSLFYQDGSLWRRTSCSVQIIR